MIDVLSIGVFYIRLFALSPHYFFAGDDQLLINFQGRLHEKDDGERDDEVEEPERIKA